MNICMYMYVLVHLEVKNTGNLGVFIGIYLSIFLINKVKNWFPPNHHW